MGDVLVLCYHAVSERWPAPLSVMPDCLDEQLAILTRRGYRGATFTEAVTAPPHKRTVAVTFDDGFRSVLDLGLPILARYGLPGTVFAASDYLDEGRPLTWDGVDHWVHTEHEDELQSLTVAELAHLRSEGWEVGSHTCSHPRLTGLEEPQLHDELARSKQALEDTLRAPCTSIAYPYGDVDGRVTAAAAHAGYRAAAAMESPRGGPRPHRWPRVGVWHTDPGVRFKLKVSPTSRRLRAAETRTRVRRALRR